MSSATSVPSSRPKVVAEKARSEKPLSISSTAISRPPKPKPMTMPINPLWLKPDEFRPHLADGVAGHDAQAQEQNADDPKRSHGLMSGLGCRGFGRRWLAPAPCARENATARAGSNCSWRWRDCWRWLARWWPSCSFCSTVPASPLPDCKSSIRFFKTSVEDSMFFTAAVMSAPFVASRRLGGIGQPRSIPARRKRRC